MPLNNTPGYKQRRADRQSATAHISAAQHAAQTKTAGDFAGTCSKLLNRLLLFALFSVVIAFSPDSSLLEPTASVNIPIINIPVPFIAFILIVPFALLGLSFHLAFMIHQLDCTLMAADDRVLTELPISLVASRNHKVLLMRNAVYHLVAPITLLAICYKAMALPRFGVPLLVFSIVVTGCISRCLWFRNRTKRLFADAVLATLCVTLVLVVASHRTALRRSLNLEGADLHGRNLSNADLVGAIATRANFSNASLSHAVLRDAVLAGANFVGTDLTAADLRGADLVNSDLTDSRLIATDFSFANMRGATLDVADSLPQKSVQAGGSTLPPPRFIGADLAGASLRGARLHRADFTLAELYQADMRLGDFDQSVFIGAMLQRADLRGDRFWEASFEGADLLLSSAGSAYFLYARFDHAILDSQNLEQLSGNELEYLKEQLKTYLGRRYWVVRAIGRVNACLFDSVPKADGRPRPDCEDAPPTRNITSPSSFGTPESDQRFATIAAALCGYDIDTQRALIRTRMQGVGAAYYLRLAATKTPCLQASLAAEK